MWTRNNKVACVISLERASVSSLSIFLSFSILMFYFISLKFFLCLRMCAGTKDCSCWSVKLLEQQQRQQQQRQRCIIKIYHTHRWRWQIVELRQRRQATTDKRQTTTGSNGLWTEDMEQTTELVRQSVRRGGEGREGRCCWCWWAPLLDSFSWMWHAWAHFAIWQNLWIWMRWKVSQ